MGFQDMNHVSGLTQQMGNLNMYGGAVPDQQRANYGPILSSQPGQQPFDNFNQINKTKQSQHD